MPLSGSVFSELEGKEASEAGLEKLTTKADKGWIQKSTIAWFEKDSSESPCKLF